VGTFYYVNPENFERMLMIMEAIYGIGYSADIVVNFLVERHDPTSSTVVRDLKVLATDYLFGSFFLDLFALVPFFQILRAMVPLRYLRVCLWIKVIRVKNVFVLLDHKVFMK